MAYCSWKANEGGGTIILSVFFDIVMRIIFLLVTYNVMFYYILRYLLRYKYNVGLYLSIAIKHYNEM